MDQEGIDARNRSQDVAERILERHERARDFVDRLYAALVALYNTHGGCGCSCCGDAAGIIIAASAQYKLPPPSVPVPDRPETGERE